LTTKVKPKKMKITTSTIASIITKRMRRKTMKLPLR
jgi:hypothetical protein